MSSQDEVMLDKTALIAKVASSLADDYHRRGGYLSGDHVLRAVEKRGLDPEVCPRRRFEGVSLLIRAIANPGSSGRDVTTGLETIPSAIRRH